MELHYLRKPEPPRPADLIEVSAMGGRHTAAFRWNWADGSRSLLHFTWGDLRGVLNVAQRVSHASCIPLQEKALEVGAKESNGTVDCPLCQFQTCADIAGEAWAPAHDAKRDRAFNDMYEHLVREHPADTKSECWGPLKARLGL
jgi:hypothetical protein